MKTLLIALMADFAILITAIQDFVSIAHSLEMHVMPLDLLLRRERTNAFHHAKVSNDARYTHNYKWPLYTTIC